MRMARCRERGKFRSEVQKDCSGKKSEVEIKAERGVKSRKIRCREKRGESDWQVSWRRRSEVERSRDWIVD